MLAVVMLINRTGSMVIPFLGVYMTQKLHFSIEESGFVLSFFGIGSVIGSWIGGKLTDTVGEYAVQSFSLFLSVPLYLLIPVFTTQWGLAGLIFFQSIITGAFQPANSVAITRYAKPQNMTRAFSLNRMALNLGFSIGPALGGILSAISYNFLFIINSFAPLLAGITFVWFFRKRKARNEIIKNNARSATRSPYKDSYFLIFCFICFLFSVFFFQFFNTLPLFYKEELHLSQAKIGYLLGLGGAIIVLLEMYFVQIVEKKWSTAFTLFFGIFLCGLSYLMLLFCSSFWWLCLSITILSIGEIWVLPFMATVTAKRSDSENKGAYMGLLGISFSLSFIITPYAGSLVAQEYGFSALWLSTGLILIGIGILMFYLIRQIIKDR
ncbi:MAG: MFS transporter [Bergeyella sp.]|nr:MFS transporter [Bergeyella sp.]